MIGNRVEPWLAQDSGRMRLFRSSFSVILLLFSLESFGVHAGANTFIDVTDSGLLLAAARARRNNPDAAADTLLGYQQDRIRGFIDEVSAATSRAHGAAAQASAAAYQVQLLSTQNHRQTADLQNIQIATGALGQEGAAMARKATAAYKDAAAVSSGAVEEAKLLAVQEVQKLFTGKYHELEQWRDTVLTDPHENAARAGNKAAEPYNKMSNAYHRQIHAYQGEARNLMTQSANIGEEAKETQADAMRRLAEGDYVNGKQAEVAAKALEAERDQLAQNAQKLQGSAEWMNNMIAQYAAAGQQARLRASYTADPNGFPPLEHDPNTAYTPPPSEAAGVDSAPAPAPAAAI